VNFSPQQRQASDNTRTLIQGTGIGAPAGIVAVYFFDTYLLPSPMPGHVGAAFGAIVTAAVVWLVQWLPRRKL
jgi:hypothetical protein